MLKQRALVLLLASTWLGAAFAQDCSSTRDLKFIVDATFVDTEFRQVICDDESKCTKDYFETQVDVGVLRVAPKNDLVVCVAKPKRKPKNFPMLVFSSSPESITYQFSYFGADINATRKSVRGKKSLAGREIGSGGQIESLSLFQWNGKEYVESQGKR